MADRILTWIIDKYPGDTTVPGAFYIENEYTPVAVRIHAQTAPDVADATFDILDDGVSIFADRDKDLVTVSTGVTKFHTPNTKIILPKGDNSETDAEDFKENLEIEEGSWITCQMFADGGGKNFTVILELDLQLPPEEDV